MEKIALPLSIVFGVVVVAFLVQSVLGYLTERDSKIFREKAVSDCLNAATFHFQELNTTNPNLVNTTVEPSRYWYTTCMQEKGYETNVNL